MPGYGKDVCHWILDTTLVGKRRPLEVLCSVEEATLRAIVKRKGRVDDIYGHLAKIFLLPEGFLVLKGAVSPSFNPPLPPLPPPSPSRLF